MGILKGDKENYLNLYITLLNKEIIGDIISEKVESLKWEYYFEAKKIDIYGKTDSGITLFIENQITQADERHLKSVIEIIEKAPNNSVVVWGAIGFSTDIMKEVSTTVHLVEDKRISFYAVEINESVLALLGKLDDMHILHVIDNLKLLNNVEVYNDIFDKYVSLCEVGIEKKEYRFERITDRERTNTYIINELRSKVKYPNIFREKRTLDTNKIRYGFGKAGIDLELVYSNRKGESFVSCQFTPHTKVIYQEIAKRRKKFEDKIGKVVVFDYENIRIVTFIDKFEHKFEKVDQLVDLMDKYILYLANYTFYHGTFQQNQMWQQKGLLE